MTQDTLHQALLLAGDLPGLLLEAERVAQTFMKGVHGRRRVGLGETFWQFRHYAPGDSQRDIDWKQTAKRDDAYVRQLEWEASQTLWLWRDGSESMDFSSSKKFPTKKHQAEVLSLALAMLALSGGEQVGMLGTELAPQSHYNSIARLADVLPRQKDLVEARPVAARSHAVLFSDFFFEPARVQAFISSLAHRQVKGALVQLFDPAEQDLPWSGRVRFHDVEDNAASLTVPQVEAIRTAYREKFIAHQAELSAVARASGWKFLAFSTAVPRETVLARLYDEMGAG